MAFKKVQKMSNTFFVKKSQTKLLAHLLKENEIYEDAARNTEEYVCLTKIGKTSIANFRPVNFVDDVTFDSFENDHFYNSFAYSLCKLYDYKISFYNNEIETQSSLLEKAANCIKLLKENHVDEEIINQMFPNYGLDLTRKYIYSSIIEQLTSSKKHVNSETVQHTFSLIKKEMNKLVGMEDLKQHLLELLFAFSNNYRVFTQTMCNFALLGKSGTGKTAAAKMISRVFSLSGIICSGDIRMTTATDLVARYVGQSGPKTRSVLFESLENVIFIDEAYALNDDTSYGSSALSELVNFIDKFIGMNVVIVAGYEDNMQTKFFGSNSGLKRRFPNVFVFEDYDKVQLLEILFKIVKERLPKSIRVNKMDLEKHIKSNSMTPGDMLNLGSKLAFKLSIHGPTKMKK